MTGAQQTTTSTPRDQQDSKTAPHGQQQNQQQGRSIAEWVSFGIASAILLAVAGLVVFFWFTAPQGPPVLEVSPAGDIREVGQQFYVRFVVTNNGGNTASAVSVLAELRIGGEVVEQGTQQFNHVAGGEQQQGTFVFRHNPQDAKLIIQIVSYKQP